MATEIETPHGPAHVHLHAAAEPRAALVLGHGAGGGVTAPDLQIANEVALEERISVALVEQPYRVAGRRSPAPAGQLDTAWRAVVEHVTDGELAGLPLITGSRSLGARWRLDRGGDRRRCRSVLAFQVHPPGRPEKSRLAELDAVEVLVLVVQGESDPFGMPPDASGREVARVKGDHSLRADRAAIADAIRSWLRDGPALRTRGR